MKTLLSLMTILLLNVAWGMDCRPVQSETELIKDYSIGDTQMLAAKAEIEKVFSYNNWHDLKVVSLKEIRPNIYQFSAQMFGSKTMWSGSAQIFTKSLGVSQDGTLIGFEARLQPVYTSEPFKDYTLRIKSKNQQVDLI